MKRIIFSIVLFVMALLSLTIAHAHVITPIAKCSANKTITVNLTQWTIGYYNQHALVAHLWYSKNNTTLWHVDIPLDKYTTIALNDSVGAITSGGFKINVPSWVTEVNGYENDSYGITKTWTSNTFPTKLTDQCIALPILLEAFNGKLDGDQLVFTWKVSMESNVDHYDIEYAKDSSEWSVLATTVSLGDTQNERTYTAQIDEPQASIAFAGLGVLASLGMVLAFVRNRKMILPMLVIATFAFTSCSKDKDAPKPHLKTTSYFRLKEVDKDGYTWNSKVIVITKY